MKKIIIITAIMALFIGNSAFALAYWQTKENSDFTVLTNVFTDNENVKVAKFKDATNTCYILTSKASYDRVSTSVSISCIK